jgi:superoxide dismutase, Fe-Mn family
VRSVSRREVVSGIALGAVALSGAGGKAMAAQAGGNVGAGVVQGGVAPGKHPILPLPFDPAKLKGLSEKLLRSHHENNYGGAVKNLNKVEEELARVNKDTPGFLVGGLKERELTFNNSMVLHELYFGNLGGDGKAADAIQRALSRAFGSFSRWEGEFRKTANALAGGSGWAILAVGPEGELHNYWAWDHTNSAPGSRPLLVLDMYEHAYHIDYGAAAARYVDAFMRNVDWEVVSRRLIAVGTLTEGGR